MNRSSIFERDTYEKPDEIRSESGDLQSSIKNRNINFLIHTLFSIIFWYKAEKYTIYLIYTFSCDDEDMDPEHI